MELAIFLLVAIAVLVLTAWAAGRQLSNHEQSVLICDRRLNEIDHSILWDLLQYKADPVEKKAMKPKGAMKRCSIDRFSFPSHAAALLKGKKHEWIIWGFCDATSCKQYWAHKGPDGTHVYINFSNDEIENMATNIGANIVYDLHNHPNSNPNLYNASNPSDADLDHAQSLGSTLASRGLCYVAFVAERGVPYPYAIYIPNDLSSATMHGINILDNSRRYFDRVRIRSEYARSSTLAKAVCESRFATNLYQTAFIK